MSYKYIDIRPNPVTGIGSYQRGFSLQDFVDLPQVEHRRIGGPWKATFRIYADDRNLAEDLLFLGVGREVNIYNDKGLVDFGGMIYVVTLSTGGSKVRSSLLDMSNRVWTRWQEAGTANPPARSTVFNNTASQALYGIKEEVWNAGQQVSIAEASQYAEKQLARSAWPTPRAIEISPGKKLSDRPILDIVCYGWWHTLSHVRYNQTAVAGGTNASVLIANIIDWSMPIPITLMSDLISWWTLNEVSGGAAPVIREDSHGTNDLTDIGTTPSAAGKVSLATQHTNAVPDYLSRVSNASLQTGDIDFSIAFWVYLDNKATNQMIVTKDDAAAGVGQREFICYYAVGPTDRFAFGVFRPVDAFVPVVDAVLGAPVVATWYFIVCWHDATANTVNIQINNGAITSVGTGGALQAAGNSEFRIGALDNPAPLALDGRVDEVAFAKRIWTADEKTAMFNGGAGIGYRDIGQSVTGDVGQFIRSVDIETNITQIEQTIDADMGADAIIKSIVDMGDVGLNNWAAGVDHTREFYYRPGARSE